MDLRPVAVALLFLPALLAGCAGKDKQPEAAADFSDLDLQATETTGIIRGVVVDNAVRPLGNVTVHLIDPARNTTTSADGVFGFDALPAGTYFMKIDKRGYLGIQQSADVVPGVREPPIVKVTLAPDAGFKGPYYEQFVFEGYIECSMGAGIVVFYGYLSACSANGQLFPNDHFANTDILSGYPDWVQSEMSWETTQAVSKQLSHSFFYDDPDETDGEKDLNVAGPSPLLNTMNVTVAKEYIEGLDYEGGNLTLGQRIFTTADGGPFGPGVGLTVQQRFTIYTTVFYGYLPPDGWMFSSGEGVPPPPT